MDNNNGGCLIWIILIFTILYGCETRNELRRTQDELKARQKNQPVVIEVEKNDESN